MQARIGTPARSSAAIARPRVSPSVIPRTTCSGSLPSRSSASPASAPLHHRGVLPRPHADEETSSGYRREQLRDRPLEPDRPRVQEGDVIGEASDLLHPLRRPDDRHPASGLITNHLADPFGAERIEVVGRFVHEQDPRLGQERSRDGQALLHPVRVQTHSAARRVLQTHHRQQLPGPGHGAALGETVEASEEQEVLQTAHPEVEAAVARGDEAEGTAEPPGGHHLQWLAEDAHITGVRDQETDQDPEQRGLPGAVGPEERMDLAGPHLEGHALERLDVTEGTVDVDDVERGEALRREPRPRARSSPVPSVSHDIGEGRGTAHQRARYAWTAARFFARSYSPISRSPASKRARKMS